MSDVIHIFVGPSLPKGVQPTAQGLVFHAPAAQGDIYTLVGSRPFAIGLVDGYFERQPAVWHKEILWALHEGVHVFGAASMGALRAAELVTFGMVGIGRVFEEFERGVLQDDDEVTIVHAEADADYRSGSEAMVNIRATLAAAHAAGLLPASVRDELVARAKAKFYPDRNYADVIAWIEGLLPAEAGERLKSWLKNAENRVDLKRQDARRLVRQILELREREPGPKRVEWAFNHTDAWEQLRRSFLSRNAESASGPKSLAAQLLAAQSGELQRDAELRAVANLRAARAELARRDGFSPTAADLTKQASQLARRHGFSDATGLRAWMEERGIAAHDLERLLHDEACAANAALIRAGNENNALLDFLLTRGIPQATETGSFTYDSAHATPGLRRNGPETVSDRTRQ